MFSCVQAWKRLWLCVATAHALPQAGRLGNRYPVTHCRLQLVGLDPAFKNQLQRSLAKLLCEYLDPALAAKQGRGQLLRFTSSKPAAGAAAPKALCRLQGAPSWALVA